MWVEGQLHISCCLGTASSQGSIAVSHLELGQLSLHRSSYLMLLWETATGGSLVRGKKKNKFSGDFTGELEITKQGQQKASLLEHDSPAWEKSNPGA